MPSRIPSPSSISKKYIEVAILEEKLAAIVVKVRLWDVEEDALRTTLRPVCIIRMDTKFRHPAIVARGYSSGVVHIE